MSEVSEVWDFPEIEASHPARSSMLASTPGKLELAALLTHRLQEAMRCNSLRMGMDQSSTNDNELRITLQFLIGEELSDRFFNATTGDRAQFRRDWQCGFSYNKVVIERVRSVLQANLPDNSLGDVSATRSTTSGQCRFRVSRSGLEMKHTLPLPDRR